MKCVPNWCHIYFEKCRDVKPPEYGTDGSAGIDFFVPEDVGWESFQLWPQTSINIPSGIKVQLPPGIALIALNKSSKGAQGIVMGATLVDPDYRGEIHLNVWNVSDKIVVLYRGAKLIQFIATPFFKLQLHEGKLTRTARGENGFGSTGSH